MAVSTASLFEPMRSFLAQESLGHFTEGHHRDVHALTKTANVDTALKVLSDSKILSAPILDEDSEYFGCVSTGDILKGLTQALESILGNKWFEKVGSVTKDDLESVGKTLGSKKVTSICHEGDLWLKGDEKTTVLTVIREGFRVLDTKGHHRIFVVDPAKSHSTTVQGQTVVINIKPGSEKPDASGLRPTDVVSQSDVVGLVASNPEKLELVKDKTIEELEVFSGSVFSIQANISALEALHHMIVDHKSSLAIVDAAGKIIGDIAISDLRFLATKDYGLLLKPVAEFKALLFASSPTHEEALNGARVAGAEEGDWAAVLSSVPVKTVAPSTTFLELLNLVAKEKVSRVYVADENGAPSSIITLTDILREVVKPEPPVSNFRRIASDYLGPVTTTDDDTSAAEN
mmetsp:Transcript_11200/g.20275  ORF Transcript_11200/g.20275 Transcript_11200/m.20275 type:complete len:403 (-) Transcript_11200:1907-3115(-)|eukprot:CAMPEP_0175049668 /NCGR_PEP_ID=MMETSP0052_2-20121109/6849_1 /TAXON_ID=51329 ORGANISM="Polytomella parva, Strain SAG 63-3" /NCGR_SAMPLE_ID=MMETSP0052_2 /ASSEMBLY_ACC=CAM_ASM_000194 /LENGTH=402 /DNA_ID=CAMNT_0016313821 /DNA_START=37 /DNA_END=1245 /DNA_ORIENTATION=+